MKIISVILIEDNQPMRKALSRLLSSDPEIQILGEAGSLNEAIRFVSKLSPDVVLLDLHLADENSITPSKAKSAFVGSRVIAMSFANDADARAIADAYGAVALLDKMSLGADLIPSLKQCGNLPPLLFAGNETGKLLRSQNKTRN
jgi:two-component system response regulator DevR